MRSFLFGAALLLATPALACPMADAAAFAAAAEKVEAAKGAKATLMIEGMHCGDCSEKIAAKLQSLEGVLAAAADYQTGKTVVAFDDAKIDEAKLRKAIEETGYKVADT